MIHITIPSQVRLVCRCGEEVTIPGVTTIEEHIDIESVPGYEEISNTSYEIPKGWKKSGYFGGVLCPSCTRVK